MKNIVNVIKAAIILASATTIGLLCGCQSGGQLSMASHRLSPTSGAAARLVDVSLFPDGIGAFEYQGAAVNNAAETINFRADQIDDVLASMVFEDTGGGRAGEITFPAQTPLAEVLHGFRVDLNGLPSRLAILAQLRGVTVKVTLRKPADKTITGRIIDLRNAHLGSMSTPLVVRTAADQDGGQDSTWVMNLLCGATLRQIRFGNVKAVRIQDPAIRHSINQALDLLAEQHHDGGIHPVTVWFHGRGRRTVGFAYLMEAPVWRMTYRLIVPHRAGSAPTGAPAVHPTLQGMAIVTNPSGSDWKNIRLDIRGGQPVSFLADLYRPFYQRRPVQPRPAGLYLRPQTYGRSLASTQGPTVVSRHEYAHLRRQAYQQQYGQTGGLGTIGGGGSLFQLNPAAAANPVPSPAHFNPLRGVQAIASGGAGSPTFDYHIDDFSVPSGQSAMAPVLVTPINARPEDYLRCKIGNAYFPYQPPESAFSALRLENNTHRYLPGGPAAIYHGAVFAGQAELPPLQPRQFRTITYAVDQAVRLERVRSKWTPTHLVKAAVKNGMLQRKGYYLVRYHLTAASSASYTKHLILCTMILPAKLVAPHPPLVNPQRHRLCRFDVRLPPHGKARLSITQRDTSLVVNNLALLSRHQILQLIQRHPHLPVSIVAAMRRGITLDAAELRAAQRLDQTTAARTTVENICTHLENAVVAMKKIPVAAKHAAAALNQQNVLYVKLSNQHAAERAKLLAATAAAAHYWATLNIPMQIAR